MIKNKVWKVTYIRSENCGMIPAWARKKLTRIADITAPTRKLAILNFRHEVGFFEIVSVGVRRCPAVKLAAHKQPQGTSRNTTDRPAFGRQYRLTGGHGVACISNGNTWAESECKVD